jgi:hypothetical protein
MFINAKNVDRNIVINVQELMAAGNAQSVVQKKKLQSVMSMQSKLKTSQVHKDLTDF